MELFHPQSESQTPRESLPSAGTSEACHCAWSSFCVTLSRACGVANVLGLAASMPRPESKRVSPWSSHQGER